MSGRKSQIRGRNLDVHRPHHGVDPDLPGVGPLADDLAVGLACLRHVCHQVAGNTSLAGEAVTHLQPAGRELPLLSISEIREVGACRNDTVLGELALTYPHLAAGADAASPAHRVENRPRAGAPPRGAASRTENGRDVPRG